MFTAVLSATAASADAGIELINSRKSDYQIVISSSASAVEEHAAAEFQTLLKQMTGVKLPVVKDITAGKGPAIYIGASRKVRGLKLQQQAAQLGADGVLIKTVGSDLILLGQNGRGQLYAVYELFERYLGVEFLAWDCTIIPKKNSVSLPSINYSYAPPFEYRHIWAYDYMNSSDKGSTAPPIAQRMRLGGTLQMANEASGGSIWTKPFSHSFNEMMPASKYYAEHPEYYALVNSKRVQGVVDAQFCLSNPEVLRICTEKVLEWCKEYPSPDVMISICPNDGAGWCECPQCSAVLAEEGSQMGSVLRFANAMAEAAERRYPGKKLCVFPYAGARIAPAVTKPRANVLAYFCHEGCYFHGFEQCDLNSQSVNRMERWRELSDGRLYYHEYMTNFSHYLAPNQNLLGLVKDIRFIAQHGVKGVSVQGQWNSPGGELVELRTYLVAKLLWDPSLDDITLRREFCKGYYGKSSEDILHYLDLLDKASEDQTIHGYGAWDAARTVSPEFVTEGLKVLKSARTHADSEPVRKRVEKLQLSLWYMQLQWPERYALDAAEAPKIIAEFRRIAAENDITHIHEAIDYTFHDLRPAPNLVPWLDQLSAKYPEAQ